MHSISNVYVPICDRQFLCSLKTVPVSGSSLSERLNAVALTHIGFVPLHDASSDNVYRIVSLCKLLAVPYTAYLRNSRAEDTDVVAISESVYKWYPRGSLNVYYQMI